MNISAMNNTSFNGTLIFNNACEFNNLREKISTDNITKMKLNRENSDRCTVEYETTHYSGPFDPKSYKEKHSLDVQVPLDRVINAYNAIKDTNATIEF